MTQLYPQPIRCCKKFGLSTGLYYNTVGGELLKSAIIETIEGGATMIQIRDKTENIGNDMSFTQ